MGRAGWWGCPILRHQKHGMGGGWVAWLMLFNRMMPSEFLIHLAWFVLNRMMLGALLSIAGQLRYEFH